MTSEKLPPHSKNDKNKMCFFSRFTYVSKMSAT